jgi:hypothetical protein
MTTHEGRDAGDSKPSEHHTELRAAFSTEAFSAMRDQSSRLMQNSDSPIGSGTRMACDTTGTRASDAGQDRCGALSDFSIKDDPKSLAQSLDRAYERWDYRDINERLKESILDAHASGGMDAVRKLEKNINAETKTQDATTAFVQQGDGLKIIHGKNHLEEKDANAAVHAYMLGGKHVTEMNKRGIYRHNGAFIQQIPHSPTLDVRLPARTAK